MLTSTPRAPAHLPLDFARCQPSRECMQRCNCARANDWPDTGQFVVVDASVSLHSEGAWCTMFIDERGAELLKAAA